MILRSAASLQLLNCPLSLDFVPHLCHTNSMNKETLSTNPYVNTLVEMGYDQKDCEMISALYSFKTFPCVIHGRTFDTKEQYDEELADYIAGL